MREILVVKTGETPDEVTRSHGDMVSWVNSLMSELGVTTSVWDAQNERPPVDNRGATIVLGSAASVHNDEQWISVLRDYLQKVLLNGSPLLGICFGCQLIASLLGNEVTPDPRGWRIGAYGNAWSGKADRALMVGAERRFLASEVHREVVRLAPAGKGIGVAFDDDGFSTVLQFGGLQWGCMFHPEMPAGAPASYATLRLEAHEVENRRRTGVLDGTRLREAADFGAGFLRAFVFASWR